MSFTSNFIANMYGPIFLIFYATVIAVVLTTEYNMVKKLDSSKGVSLRAPSTPDPYEVAFLRGGRKELINLVIFELIHEKFLILTDDLFIKRNLTSNNIYNLSPIKRTILNWFVNPAKIEEIFKSKDKIKMVDDYCRKIEKKLIENKMINSPELKKEAFKIGFASAGIIVFLAAYKIFIAINTHHYNVGFLFFMGIIAIIISIKLTRLTYISKSGKAYLQSLKLAFYNLKPEIKNNSSIVEPEILLASSIFGLSILSDSAYASQYDLIFKKYDSNPNATNTGSSCGSSSCGSSGCSGGSSCSGGSGCGGCGGGGCG